MIFSTYWFLTACTVFLIGFSTCTKAKSRTLLLILFCIGFHAHFAGAAGVSPIIALGLMTYICARLKSTKAQSFAIVICICALILYKYSHFICTDLVGFLNASIAERVDNFLAKALPQTAPLAISFFVFEFVHYLWDVRKGNKPITKPHEFAQFALFFPSLVAGPIKRYEQFIPALNEGKKRFDANCFSQGLLQTAGGFFKKVVLADNLTIYIKATAPQFGTISVLERWIFVFALSLRIYFDFSGYSDIAIGIARMMNIELPANFNWPYLSKNLQEFWHRWHISLSLWIRDYIYIPLGGSHHGTARRIFNGLCAFALCGLWHGAAWNFVLWGLFHGVGLSVSSTYKRHLGWLGERLSALFDKLPALAVATTFAYVSVGWLLFFYPLPEAVRLFTLLFQA